MPTCTTQPHETLTWPSHTIFPPLFPRVTITWPSSSTFQLPSFSHFVTSVLNSQISPKIPKLPRTPWENSSPVPWENSILFQWNDFPDKSVRIRTTMWSGGRGERRNLKLNLPHRFWHLRFSYVCISVSLCVNLFLCVYIYLSITFYMSLSLTFNTFYLCM